MIVCVLACHVDVIPTNIALQTQEHRWIDFWEHAIQVAMDSSTTLQATKSIQRIVSQIVEARRKAYLTDDAAALGDAADVPEVLDQDIPNKNPGNGRQPLRSCLADAWGDEDDDEEEGFGKDQLSQVAKEFALSLPSVCASFLEAAQHELWTALLNSKIGADKGLQLIEVDTSNKDQSLYLSQGEAAPTKNELLLHYAGRVTTSPTQKSMPLARAFNKYWYLEPLTCNVCSELVCPAWLVKVDYDVNENECPMIIQTKVLTLKWQAPALAVQAKIDSTALQVQDGKFVKKSAKEEYDVDLQLHYLITNDKLLAGSCEEGKMQSDVLLTRAATESEAHIAAAVKEAKHKAKASKEKQVKPQVASDELKHLMT